ncbi:hypothetical protein [Aquamicrobium terrae]|uniref:Uncharacterized protein n=1 Tax=Aquamicrobium terrae TaxID=1324945 RepID=A0ABV2N4M6_9HYPH
MLRKHTSRLPPAGRRRLLSALKGRLLAACFGAGVDSTAMLVALYLAGLQSDIIMFADLAAEKPETMAHLERMNAVFASWGWGDQTVPAAAEWQRVKAKQALNAIAARLKRPPARIDASRFGGR